MREDSWAGVVAQERLGGRTPSEAPLWLGAALHTTEQLMHQIQQRHVLQISAISTTAAMGRARLACVGRCVRIRRSRSDEERDKFSANLKED